MDIFKKVFFFIFLISSVGFLASCEDDDDNDDEPIPEVDRGNVHPNRFKFEFVRSNDTTDKATYEFYDLDGKGGNDPIKADTLIFNIANAGGKVEYFGNIEFFKDSTNLTSEILNLSQKYMVCYRNQYGEELRPFNFSRDVNNVILGLSAEWEALDLLNDPIATGEGDLRITLNYNILRKDGTCDAGVRVFDGTVPYKLKVN